MRSIGLWDYPFFVAANTILAESIPVSDGVCCLREFPFTFYSMDCGMSELAWFAGSIA